MERQQKMKTPDMFSGRNMLNL